MAMLPPIPRARILMRLVQTAEVTHLDNYAADQLDYQDPATSLKWAENVWDAYGPPTITDGEGNSIPAPKTNANMARFMLWQMREKFFKRAATVARTSPAVTTARAAEEAAIDTEADIELGTNEDLDAE
jgi:hypothetical protein